ncbi:MAG: calcium/sodium antiporter [Ruminococcaceae bacterium]|nr:calcium/sodium antiporter [Oscillospiraceae bacterium]
MLIPILLFAVGLVLLIKGGDWFVDGATGVAHRFNLPEILIGATVVSIGTTLPEVMVSAQGAMAGSGAMAYGNAIGSIICNTSLIAALTIAIKPGKADRKSMVVPGCFFFGAAAFYATIAYTTGDFSRWVGVVLLSVFAVYMLLTVLQMKKNPELAVAEGEEEEGESSLSDEEYASLSFFKKALAHINGEKNTIAREIVLLVVGAAVIALGANLLVDNGTIIAEKLGVPETVIALTFVALGTSLPELVTAITSLAKGHGALSLGNIIGANLFNLVLVSGVAVTISPFPVPNASQLFGMNASLVMDIPVAIGAMLIMVVPALIRQKLSRVQGIMLLAIYAAFCTVQFVM